MKTNIRFIALLLIFTTTSALRAQSFQKGQTDLNLGIGIGNIIIGSGSSNVFPPLSVALEYGITQDISLGAYLGFTGASYSFSSWEDCGHGNGNGQYYTDTYKWSYFIAGVRGAFHFGRFIPNEKLDVYAGLMLGNDFAHSSYSTTSLCPDHREFFGQTYGGGVFSVYAGARYRFTNRIGIFGELGYGISYLTIGVNFKF